MEAQTFVFSFEMRFHTLSFSKRVFFTLRGPRESESRLRLDVDAVSQPLTRGDGGGERQMARAGGAGAVNMDMKCLMAGCEVVLSAARRERAPRSHQR